MNQTRRTFIKTTGLGALGFLLTGKTFADTDSPFVVVRGNCFTYNKSGGTILIHQTKDTLSIVDTQFPANVESFIPRLNLSEMRKIDLLINTHHHGDHTGGNQILGKYASKMIAHQRVPELLKEIAAEKNQDLGLIPTTTFESEWKQTLGKETVHAFHFGPAHTGGDAVIYFEQDGVAHMGDLVFNRAHPNIDRKAGASISNWITFLNKTIDKLPKDTRFVFGHANPELPNNGTYLALQEFARYLNALLEKAKKGIESGMTKEEFLVNPTLDGFESFGLVSNRLNLPFVLGMAWDEINDAK